MFDVIKLLVALNSCIFYCFMLLINHLLTADILYCKGLLFVYEIFSGVWVLV